MYPINFFDIIKERIAIEFQQIPQSGILQLVEQHTKDKITTFQIGISAKHFSFSLDVKGLDPFPIFSNKIEGLKSKNDLIIFCQNEQDTILVFLLELKSKNSTGAGHQLRCGKAFCEYLFNLLQLEYPNLPKYEYFAILVKQPRFPPKGTTKPSKIKFQLSNGLKLCEWDVSQKLFLASLIKATET